MKAVWKSIIFLVLTNVSAKGTLGPLTSMWLEVVNWRDEESMNGCLKENTSF